MWRIRQVINNNVVLASQDGADAVLVGRGLGYQHKVGDTLTESGSIQVFRSTDTQPIHMARLIAELTPAHIDVAVKLARLAAKTCDVKLPDSTVIALADHLRFAVDRVVAGKHLPNPVAWEVRHLYPTEFEFGCKALELAKREVGVQLDESEAVSFALHVVNASFAIPGGQMMQTQRITESLLAVVDMVEAATGHRIDRNSAAAARFLTHLRFLYRRIVARGGKPAHDSDTGVELMAQTVADSYPLAWAVAAKVMLQVQMDLDAVCAADEQVYLMLHIARLLGATR